MTAVTLDRFDRLGSLAVALWLNVLFFWFLQASLVPQEQAAAVESPTDLVMVIDTFVRRKDQSEKPDWPKADARVEPRMRASKMPADPVVFDSSESEQPTAPLDLRLPEHPLPAGRGPMERRSALADPHLNRLNLSFQDRSVGGTMQRMVKAGICKDLRNALTSGIGDAIVVVNTMKQHGCRV